MKVPAVLSAFAAVVLVSLPAYAGPRDAEATLNRCGRPLKGDLTEYANSGSRRLLKYERGTLTFTRVGNEGWTFDHGMRRGKDGLNAEAMEVFMPCLKDALADSVAPGPIVKISSVARLESSMKRAYRKVILWTMIGLVMLGIFFFLLSKRPRNDHDLVR